MPQGQQYDATIKMLMRQNELIRAANKSNAKYYTPGENAMTVSQGYLESECKLVSTTSAYQFNFNDTKANITNGGAITVNEERLALQNMFVGFEIFYGLRIQQTNGGSGVFKDQLFTHPPGQVNSGSNTDTLAALWNGNYAFQANNQPVTVAADLWRHYENPTTQYPVYGTLSTSALYPVNDEQYGSTSGWYPVVPGWIMDGAFNNVINVNFNNSLSGIGLPTAAGSEYRAVIIMRGMLCQNCSEIMVSGLSQI